MTVKLVDKKQIDDITYDDILNPLPGMPTREEGPILLLNWLWELDEWQLMSVQGVKYCSRCKQVKWQTYFNHNEYKDDNFQNWCRICQGLYSRGESTDHIDNDALDTTQYVSHKPYGEGETNDN